MASAGRILIMPKGVYDANVQYEMLDMVSYNGKGFLCKQRCKGVTPVEGAYWMVVCDLSDDIETINNNIAELNDDLGGHTSNKSNPHGVTKAQLGLDKVDNTPDSQKDVASAKADDMGRRISETYATKTDLTNYLPKNGTATKATADANGNNIANTYATKSQLSTVEVSLGNIDEALPFTIVIDDNTKTINFIDR